MGSEMCIRDSHYVPALRRTLIWGIALPFAVIIGAFITPWALALALLWPLKIIRLVARGFAPTEALFLTLGNFAEAAGVFTYIRKRLSGQRSHLIEYK